MQAQVLFFGMINCEKGWEKGCLHAADRSGVFWKKGYLYFSFTLEVVQHGHRGGGDWQ